MNCLTIIYDNIENLARAKPSGAAVALVEAQRHRGVIVFKKAP